MKKDTLEVLQWRYAVKKFDPGKTLSPSQITLLKQAFNLTATSFGLQPVKLLVVSDQQTKEDLFPFTYYQKQITDASHLLIFCIIKNVDETYVNKYFDLVREIRNTSETILNPYRNSLIHNFQNKSEDKVSEWAKNQAYLTLGNILTVCAVEGIDSCPIEGFMTDRYDTYFSLEKLNLQSVLVLPVGYRAEDDLFATLKKVRADVEDQIIDWKTP